MANTYAKFLADLKAELQEEGYEFVRLNPRSRELRIRPVEGEGVVEIYAQCRMGEGVNNSFTRTWPPGFEFCGSERI
jgi:hypothetical protein